MTPAARLPSPSGGNGFSFASSLIASGPNDPFACAAISNGEIARIMNLPEVKKLVLAQGAEPWTATPQQFAQYMQRETALWRDVIKTNGIALH